MRLLNLSNFSLFLLETIIKPESKISFDEKFFDFK